MQRMLFQVICGSVIVRAFHTRYEAEMLAASWRRAGSVAHVVARFV